MLVVTAVGSGSLCRSKFAPSPTLAELVSEPVSTDLRDAVTESRDALFMFAFAPRIAERLMQLETTLKQATCSRCVTELPFAHCNVIGDELVCGGCLTLEEGSGDRDGGRMMDLSKRLKNRS